MTRLRLQRGSLALSVLGAALLLLLVCNRAEAATFTVNTTADTPLAGAMCTGSEPCSLRAAVQAADGAGGTNVISVPAGTYALTVASTGADDPANGDLDIDQSSSVTIQGAGSGSTVIDANGIDRAFAVQEASSLDIAGMTIEGGLPAATSSGTEQGGAIWAMGNLGAGPDLVLTGNQAIQGGAVYVGSTAAAASFTKVVVAQNQSTGQEGGGIDVEMSGKLTLTDSLLTENEAVGGENPSGGNLYVGAVNELESTDTDYTEGIARDGGGIRISYAATSSAIFTGGSISDNHTGASGRGGGMNLESPVSLIEVTLAENTSTERGGAISVGSPVPLHITGSTFVGNTSENSGAIDVGSYEPAMDIVNSTFTGNGAAQGGSVFGAYYFLGKFDLVNSTVAANVGPAPAISGLGLVEPFERGVVNSIIAGNAGGDCESELTIDSGHNIVGSTCEPATPVASDLVGLDPQLSPLAANGGRTETMAPATTSPAIGAGDQTACPAVDQRGVPRTGGCDIGAYQPATPKPEPTPEPTPNPETTPNPTGDSGTPIGGSGPSPAGPAPPTAAAKYKFGIKKIVHVQEGGAARLKIRYNGPGLIQLSGKRVIPVSQRTKAGVAYLPITPDEALATLLTERRRVHVSVLVQFTPDAGVGRIKEKKVGVWLYG